MNEYIHISKLVELNKNFNDFYAKSLPLCAAENIISDFVKWPLSKAYQERYIMGSAYNFSMSNNFIGSETLLPFYKMIVTLCRDLFHAKYCDCRTLTGMNAANLLAASLIKPGDKVMILSKEYGGHASMRLTFERYGAVVYDAPYLLDDYDFDYKKMNHIIEQEHIKFLNIAPSDILFEHAFENINDAKCTILFDYSQILGLIAAGLLKNPLDYLNNCILFGGTHKTLPGPTHGLILTNNKKLFEVIDKEINPQFLRNIQTHQVVSLLFALIEAKEFGKMYQMNTVKTANILGKMLENRGFNVVSKNNVFTETHQLFIETSREKMNTIFRNAVKEHITLNTKTKQLFHGGYGIRLGLQEISRYKWNVNALKIVADIVKEISHKNYNKKLVSQLFKKLPEKKIYYTFNKKVLNSLNKTTFK